MERFGLKGPALCTVVDKAQAKGLELLSRFCCGHCSASESAREVNLTAQNLYDGDAVPQHAILLEDEQRDLVGLSSVILTGDLRLDPVPYLNGYGREKRLKGYMLADGKTTLGEALLRAAIELASGDAEPPEIQALVREDNEQSHGPLASLGFERIPNVRVVPELPAGFQAPPGIEVVVQPTFRTTLPSGKVFDGGQEVWRRPAGLEPPAALPADVYAGPNG